MASNVEIRDTRYYIRDTKYSGEPHVLVSADTSHKSLFGKQGKALNILEYPRLMNHRFSRLLKKAISMALWTKASLCGKSSLLEQSLPRTPSRLKTSVFSVAKNLFNQRNQRLINDLRAYKALYICRDTFTEVMSALQINLFMQNKPKFRKSQMNVNKVLTMDYDKKTLGQRGKKQSQTKPNSKRPK